MKEQDGEGKMETKVKEVISDLETRVQVVLLDLERMKETDGHDQWRQTEARDLSDLVQARLKHLQNPEDCSKARKLVCKLNSKMRQALTDWQADYVDGRKMK